MLNAGIGQLSKPEDLSHVQNALRPQASNTEATTWITRYDNNNNNYNNNTQFLYSASHKKPRSALQEKTILQINKIKDKHTCIYTESGRKQQRTN